MGVKAPSVDSKPSFLRKIARPPSILPSFSAPLSYFLGYRKSKFVSSLPSSILRPWHFQLIDLLLITLAVFLVLYLPQFMTSIPASAGAAAILIFTAPKSPLGQPRNAIISQVFAAVIGVSMSKLYQKFPQTASSSASRTTLVSAVEHSAGPLATTITSVFMYFTDTIHPPAGATALIAVFHHQEWGFVVVIFLLSLFMVGFQCIVGNLLPVAGRRWPLYWWWEDPPVPQTIGASHGEEETIVTLSMDSIMIPEWMKDDEDCVNALETVRRRILEINACGE